MPTLKGNYFLATLIALHFTPVLYLSPIGAAQQIFPTLSETKLYIGQLPLKKGWLEIVFFLSIASLLTFLVYISMSK